MPLRVVVVVEGHGEDGAIRTLLERIWYEFLHGDYIEVIPWRGKQGQLRRKDGLARVVEAAAERLHATAQTDSRRLLLILMDTEGQECPRNVAPERLAWLREVRSDVGTEIACVLPNHGVPRFVALFSEANQRTRIARSKGPLKEQLYVICHLDHGLPTRTFATHRPKCWEPNPSLRALDRVLNNIMMSK